MYYLNKGSVYFYRINILNKNKNKFILENISLSLNNISINLIKGKNGSGKTTIINYLSKNIEGQFTKTKLSNLFLVLQLNIKSYFSISALKSILEMSYYLNTLSYGYIKNFFLILKWNSIASIYSFDESFNGLDKYFILKLNKIFIYINNIFSKKIQVSHLNMKYKNKSTLFLD